MSGYFRVPLVLFLAGIACQVGLGCSSSSDTAPAQQGQPVAQPPQAYAPQPAVPSPQAQAGQPVQPTAPAQPAQDPMAALKGLMGQAAGQPGQAPVQPGTATNVPWEALSQALPTNAPGWALDGQVEGESASIMGISISRANCRLKQGNLRAKVQIVDTTMNPMLAMPFNMARTVRVDSSKERLGPVDFGTHPGTQKFEKGNNTSEVMILVQNRILVTVTVQNATSEAEAVGLGQYVNFAHLAKLAGGQVS
ncbi:MAG: hypothetical protein QNJ97_20990 [Myxococcota bacterium]|nr:hypothetical protein [Myxococcota bacterium]